MSTGSTNARNASGRSLLITANTTSRSLGFLTPRSCKATPSGPATSSVAFASSAIPSLFLFQTIATLESLGLKQLQSLGPKVRGERRDTRDVATRMRQTRDNARSNRIARTEENDRDCFCSLLKSE